MSKDSWDSYKGLQVPPKHGALFNAMDQQERFYAEIMRQNEISRKNAVSEFTQKAIRELDHIKLNHLTVLDFKVLNEISTKTDDPVIVDLLKQNISADLSSHTLFQNSYIFQYMKYKIPHFFKDYKDIYDDISHPFNKVAQDLLKVSSPYDPLKNQCGEVESIKNTFLQNLNHLNNYFEYSEGNNNQSPISEISCKESLLKVVEDMGLKLENFNEAKNEQEVLVQNNPKQPSTLSQEKVKESQFEEEIKKPHHQVQELIKPLNQILDEEDDLLAMIQKLKASLEQERNKNIEKDIQLKNKDVQIADLTKENKDVNDRFKQSQEIIQELKVDKFDLRGTIEILKQSNQDKVVKIEDVKKLLHEKEVQYDALKIQYDNIMDIGMEQNEDMQNVPVLGGNHESSQSNSFELI